MGFYMHREIRVEAATCLQRIAARLQPYALARGAGRAWEPSETCKETSSTLGQKGLGNRCLRRIYCACHTKQASSCKSGQRDILRLRFGIASRWGLGHASRCFRLGKVLGGSRRLKVALANIPEIPRLSHEKGFNTGLRIY